MIRSLELENIGPIQGIFPVDFSDGPGLYEARGSKGVGKTTVINALQLIGGHKVSLTVNDSELEGRIAGFGVIVPVGNRKRAKGECEIEVLDTNRCDFGDLINPDGKTAATRDATRLKALAQLSRLVLAPRDFQELVGGLEQVEDLNVKSADDAVTYCSRIKAALEEKARGHEAVAEREQAHAEANTAQCDGLDLDAECAASTLAQQCEDAAAGLAALRNQSEARAKAIGERNRARLALEDAERAYDGPSVDKAKRDAEKAERMKRDAEEALKQAKAAHETAFRLYETATAVLSRATSHKHTISMWQSTLDAELPEEITDAQIKEAEEMLLVARQEQENGVKIREALKARETATQHEEAAKESTVQADRYRRMAAGVWGVMTKKLKTSHISIESVDGVPRLVVQHPRRGKTLFDADNGLSDGERVRVAIEEMLPHLGRPGLFPVPQRVYQDLPPADRRELAQYAEKNDVYVVGGQVTDGELRVVRYEVDGKEDECIDDEVAQCAS